MTTIAWGQDLEGDFNAPADTTPTGGTSTNSYPGGVNGGVDGANWLGSGLPPFYPSFFIVDNAQYGVNFSTNYFILEYSEETCPSDSGSQRLVFRKGCSGSIGFGFGACNGGGSYSPISLGRPASPVGLSACAGTNKCGVTMLRTIGFTNTGATTWPAQPSLAALADYIVSLYTSPIVSYLPGWDVGACNPPGVAPW